jgi:HAD superfamily hydrolase (TIGR01490 family)
MFDLHGNRRLSGPLAEGRPFRSRRRTGIEPARQLVAASSVLKTEGPTRNPDASVVQATGRTADEGYRTASPARRTMPTMTTTTEAAFFDLDKTIVSRSSSLALSRPLYRAGMVSRGQLLRGAYAQLVYLLVGADEQKMERLKEGMLQLTKGWDRGQVERLVQEAVLDVIDPYVYEEAMDLLEQHRLAGRRIYIVSSSPEEVVRPLARHFGASGVIATRAQVGEDNRYTGELEFYAYGQQKAHAILDLAARSGLDLEGSYAYSDSATDVPMLEVVGHPVAVNPDKELRRVAEEREWEVLDFRKPVRLRTRIVSVVPESKPGVLAAAFGVVAVAGILIWVTLRSHHRARTLEPERV